MSEVSTRLDLVERYVKALDDLERAQDQERRAAADVERAVKRGQELRAESLSIVGPARPRKVFVVKDGRVVVVELTNVIVQEAERCG